MSLSTYVPARCVVNDCLVEVDFRHKFAAGKAEDFSLYMPILDMMLYGIREISSIDIEFRIAAASGEKVLYRAYPPVRRFRTAAGTGRI